MTVSSEVKMKKKLFIYLLICSSVLFTLISLVLSPLYSVVTSNVAYMYSLLPSIILLLIDIINFFAITLCYSIIAYSIIKFGMAASTSFITTYIIAIFLKYTIDMLISYFILKRINVYTVVNSVSAFFIDLLLVLVAVFVAYRRYKKDKSLKKTALGYGILLAISKVLSRVVYDISVGPPTDLTDLTWMITSYLFDIVIGGVFFISILLMFKHLKRKETAE